MPKHRVIELTDEFKKRVVNAYNVKGMSLNLIVKNMCNLKMAKQILNEAGVVLDKNGMRLRKYLGQDR